MRHLITVGLIAFAASAAAAPDYRTIVMEIEVNKPAAAVWDRVGHYCDIERWLDVQCKIVTGDGGIGTVRSLDNGRVEEIMIARTDLSYGYTQPVKEGAFYNLYHGFLEAQPISSGRSKLVYTMFYDASDKADEAAKQAVMTQRRNRFEGALKKMKQIAEQ